ncbi:MAG TPA: OmpA family protein [Bryobacteraceae bacterium]|nr:OmpA family protein [Bryobacteraceae bacterium]
MPPSLPLPVPLHNEATQVNGKEVPLAPIVLFFSVEPLTIEHGQKAAVKWMVRNATSVSITPDLGTVEIAGERSIFPEGHTQIILTATGPGGSAIALAELNTVPSEGVAPGNSAVMYQSPDFGSDIPDLYFDLESAQLRGEALNSLRESAAVLKSLLDQMPALRVAIAGHSDELGSAAYDLALSGVRAGQVENFLVEAGLPPERLRTIALGSEAPICSEQTEDCWKRNRRVHIAPTR